MSFHKHRHEHRHRRGMVRTWAWHRHGCRHGLKILLRFFEVSIEIISGRQGHEHDHGIGVVMILKCYQDSIKILLFDSIKIYSVHQTLRAF